MQLLIDGNHGIYVPQYFAQHYFDFLLNSDVFNREDLNNPDNEHYLDTWGEIVDTGIIVLDDVQYTLLEEDGDLFIIPTAQVDTI